VRGNLRGPHTNLTMWLMIKMVSAMSDRSSQNR